jgi:OmcA/MtrC family decaheme c-type cytochrome
MPPVSVNFKDMIHKIHSGENLEQDYTVYGFGETAHDFTEIRFPGERQECSICHEDDTTSIPLPDEAISTLVTQDNGMTVISEMLPTRAACISCHDSISADSHALGQTVNNVETCSVCHSDNDDLSVALIHALSP